MSEDSVLPAVRGDPDHAEPGRVTYADVTESGELRPVIPAQWRRGSAGGTLRHHARRHAHKAAYHGVRSPAYAIRTAGYAVRGAGVLTWKLLAWWHWRDGWILESQAVAAGRAGHLHAMAAHTEGKKTRAKRGRILAWCAAAAGLGGVALYRYAPWWAWALVAAAVGALLVRHGKPQGKTIVAPAVLAPKYEKPTHPIITTAFDSLGIKAISDVIASGKGLAFLNDVHRDGEGWGTDLDLPHGVTASMILQRRPQLASGLRRPLSATWPEPVPHEHEARLRLWIGFTDLSQVKPKPWPLARTGQADIFGRIPFAVNPRGATVYVPVFEANWLIGAGPGEGKTAAVRVFACAAALDPVCDLWVHELAGKGDLEAFAQVSHRYCSGLDDEAIEYAALSLYMLRADLERRSERFKKIPRELKPDGKLTRELARDRRLRPVVAIFDEAQNLFMHPKFGDKAKEDAAHVIRLGRAYGIVIILSTQRPDKDSIPTTITGVITSRFCLKVPDQVGNDMILGTGAYKAGYDSVAFRHEIDAGLGWLRGSGEAQAVRTFYLDLKAAKRITDRARALRQAAGVLSGYALGEDDGTTPRDVLADVLQVLGADTAIHWSVLAQRLEQAYPDRWAETTAEAVSAQCRALDVASVQVKVGGINLQGCRRLDVERVAGER